MNDTDFIAETAEEKAQKAESLAADAAVQAADSTAVIEEEVFSEPQAPQDPQPEAAEGPGPAEADAPAEPQPAAAPADGKKAKKAKKPMTPEEKKDNIKEWIKDLGTAVIIALIFLQLITPTLVREHSMENTLFQNDYLIVSRRHYSWFGQNVERGDIIVFDSDLTTQFGFKKMLVKRIIGIPGDTVSISNGKVYVNGAETDQSYTKDGYTAGAMAEVTVPEGCIFVLGDNRQNSTDSRRESVGFVPISKLRGKVVLRLFPLNRAGGLY